MSEQTWWYNPDRGAYEPVMVLSKVRIDTELVRDLTLYRVLRAGGQEVSTTDANVLETGKKCA